MSKMRKICRIILLLSIFSYILKMHLYIYGRYGTQIYTMSFDVSFLYLVLSLYVSPIG